MKKFLIVASLLLATTGFAMAQTQGPKAGKGHHKHHHGKHHKPHHRHHK